MDYNESKAIGELGNKEKGETRKKTSDADAKEYNFTSTHCEALTFAYHCFTFACEILVDKRHGQLHDSQCPQNKSLVFRRNSYFGMKV